MLEYVINRLSVQKPCTKCDGTGTVTNVREKRVDELTQKQFQFLFEAWLQREEAKWGGDDNNTSNMPSNTSLPSGAPPVNGATRRM